MSTRRLEYHHEHFENMGEVEIWKKIKEALASLEQKDFSQLSDDKIAEALLKFLVENGYFDDTEDVGIDSGTFQRKHMDRLRTLIVEMRNAKCPNA